MQKADLRNLLAELLATTTISDNQLDGIIAILDRAVALDDRVCTLENEYNHMVIDKNQGSVTGGFGDWIEANKNILIVIGIVLGLVLVFRESKCDCGKHDLGSDILKTASTYAVKKIFR